MIIKRVMLVLLLAVAMVPWGGTAALAADSCTDTSAVFAVCYFECTANQWIYVDVTTAGNLGVKGVGKCGSADARCSGFRGCGDVSDWLSFAGDGECWAEPDPTWVINVGDPNFTVRCGAYDETTSVPNLSLAGVTAVGAVLLALGYRRRSAST